MMISAGGYAIGSPVGRGTKHPVIRFSGVPPSSTSQTQQSSLGWSWAKTLAPWGMILGAFLAPGWDVTSGMIRQLFSATPPEVKVPASSTVYPNNVNVIVQKGENACGSTALAMAMNALSPETPVTEEDINVHIRRIDFWATPDILAAEARRRGFQAEIYNQSSQDEIRAHLAQGNAVIALIKVGERGSFLAHYELITGSTVTEELNALYIAGSGSGKIEVVPWQQFDKDWRNVDIGGVPTGHDRLILVVSRQPLPPGRFGYMAVNTVANNTAQIVNNLVSWSAGDLQTAVVTDAQNGSLFRTGLVLGAVGWLLAPLFRRRENKAE